MRPRPSLVVVSFQLLAVVVVVLARVAAQGVAAQGVVVQGVDVVADQPSLPETPPSKADTAVVQLLALLPQTGAPSQPPAYSEPWTAQASETLAKLEAYPDNADALWTLGEAALFGKYQSSVNPGQSARDWYEALTRLSGNASAHYRLGFLYATESLLLLSPQLSVASQVAEEVKEHIAPRPGSQAKALLHYHLAALANHSLAELSLGFRYLVGIGVPSNCPKALIYYRKAADQVIGYLKGQFYIEMPPAPPRLRLAEEYGGVYGAGASGAGATKDTTDPILGNVAQEDIVQYYQYNAERGDVTAQWYVGRFFYRGSSLIPRNFRKAFTFLRLASSALSQLSAESVAEASEHEKEDIQAAAEATAILAQMYVRGEGVVQNYQTALELFRRSVRFGSLSGTFGLGLMYQRGIGVEKNMEEALAYFQRAAKSDHVEAHVALGTHFAYGLHRDHTLALRHLLFASNRGHIVALYYLARFHQEGIMVDSSCSIAAKLLKTVVERGDYERKLLSKAVQARKSGSTRETLVHLLVAAEAGFEIAQSNIALMIDKEEWKLGSRTAQGQQALLYWNRAANQGNVDARIKVGDYFYYGLGTKMDPKKASLYYHAAESENSALAMFNLGYMHENGIGLEKDFHLAKRFYDQALATNPSAYFPVSLALTKLQMKQFFRWLRHGGTLSLDPPDISTAAQQHVEHNRLAEEQTTETGTFFDDLLLEHEHADSMQQLKEDAEFMETALIVILAFVAVAIVLHRQRRQEAAAAALHMQGAGEAPR